MKSSTLLLTFLFLGGGELRAADDDADVVLRALSDELQRSMERLRLEKNAGPYYLEYAVEGTDNYEVAASFGALTGRSRRRNRNLSVDLRVGDYSLDNTNFGGGEFGFGALFGMAGGFGESVTTDDDYDALRHELWLKTDAAYKSAIEELEAKKAYLQENTVQDRPDDLSREEPVVSVEPAIRLEIDEERWASAARKLSAVFREFPRVQKSLVMFVAKGQNRWFVNSEGFRNRGGKVECGVILLAQAQADDGMSLSDFEVFAGRGEKDLRGIEEMEKAARGLGERLTKLAEAPAAEEYRGPILLEGQAAAEFFAQILAPNLGHVHEPLGSKNALGAILGNQLREKLGQRILPAFLSVVDDPAARDFGGVPLLGGWQVDDDGVRAQKVILVEKGVLKSFCMSRIPTRKLKKSNGHSKGGAGTASILFVQSEASLGAKELREKLIELGKEDGLEHVYIARRLANVAASLLNPQSLMGSMMSAMTGGGGVGLLPPVLLYRISVADGKEELVRGAQFGRLTLRVLRDIVATGDDAAPHLVVQGREEAGHLVAPSILVKEIEIQKPGRETEKPPALKNAFFEK